ncbi:MAG: nucleotidyltransferase family protein [Phycisphaerae bacterium]|nr:nucleotidyltransferase family protein [Phycisphaerae bacterium]MDZ4829423.1 nucleotidyltransferase family protein [Phycisphaerae bacterium]
MRSSELGGTSVVVVLAAGRGLRMGGPKALMTVLGQSWWRLQAERISATEREAVWVVSPEVRAAITLHPAAPAWLTDADPTAPMFSSIVAGVNAARGFARLRWVHVLPVDVPAPHAATLNALEVAADTAGVAVPAHAGKTGHPICLTMRWIEATLFPALEHASVESRRLDVLAAQSRTIVEVADADVVVNLNTPDAVAQWAKRQPAPTERHDSRL